jgi:hypothetical protein
MEPLLGGVVWTEMAHFLQSWEIGVDGCRLGQNHLSASAAAFDAAVAAVAVAAAAAVVVVAAAGGPSEAFAIAEVYCEEKLWSALFPAVEKVLTCCDHCWPSLCEQCHSSSCLCHFADFSAFEIDPYLDGVPVEASGPVVLAENVSLPS